jgi:hypothetical protein
MTTRYEFEQRRHEVADYILEHPNEFDMSTFGVRTNACGTVGCIAGTAAFIAEAAGKVELDWSSDLLDRENLDVVVHANGEAMDVDDFAMEYLGMTSTKMFYDSSLAVPEKAAKALLEEPYVDDEIDS